MGESLATMIRLLTRIEDDGDCLVHQLGRDRADWRVTSLRPHVED